MKSIEEVRYLLQVDGVFVAEDESPVADTDVGESDEDAHASRGTVLVSSEVIGEDVRAAKHVVVAQVILQALDEISNR